MMENDKLKQLANYELTLKELLEKGKEDLALAILLWKELKGMPPEGDWAYSVIWSQKMSDALGCRKEFDKLLKETPAMRITPK